jgi:hypothetical protein
MKLTSSALREVNRPTDLRTDIISNQVKQIQGKASFVV